MRVRRRLGLVLSAVCLGILFCGVLPRESARAAGTGAIPKVWFCPNAGPGPTLLGLGAVDVMSLFTPSAPWSQAAGHIQVYKCYNAWIESLTDAQLQTVINDLKRRNISLGMELESVTPYQWWDPTHTSDELNTLQRIKNLGGVVGYVQFDEPLFLGGALVTQAPNLTIADIAQRTAAFAQGMKAIFPGIVVGDIEPVVDHMNPGAIQAWIRAYQAASGTPFAYVVADVVRGSYPEWPQATLAMEQTVKGEGIPFGLINYSTWDLSDAAWIQEAQDNLAVYEGRYGGRPDMAVFQSWDPLPSHCLPETDPTAFTYLVNRYFVRRTLMKAGRTSVKLTDDAGLRMAGVPVEYTVYPVRGPGSAGHYEISGTVLTGAKTAWAGLRVNTESTQNGPIGTPGFCDLSVYRMSYTEGSSTQNLVPNPDFSQGLQGWTLYGQGGVQPSDQGSGSMLHVYEGPGQTTSLSATVSSVTPGAAFHFSVDARVAPGASKIGYFMLSFFNQSGAEIARTRIRLDPAPVSTGVGFTDSGGKMKIGGILKAQGIRASSVTTTFHYAGDAMHWPAFGWK